MPVKPMNHQMAVIATRIVEAVAVGAIVLYGNIKVIESNYQQQEEKMQEIADEIGDISGEVRITRTEQLLRTHKVKESYEHAKDYDLHRK